MEKFSPQQYFVEMADNESTRAQVWIANFYSGATVGPWVKERTYFGVGGIVQQGQISVPRTLLIC